MSNPEETSNLVKRNKENEPSTSNLSKRLSTLPNPPEPTSKETFPISQKRVNISRLLGAPAKKKNEYEKVLTKKAKAHLETFKRSMQLSSQIPENERIRQRIRENFFYGLVYGFEELRYKISKKLMDASTQGNASDLVAMADRAQIDYVKGLTLEIEANLYHRFKRDVKKSSEYSGKSRLISMNLKQKKNFELRLKVLTRQISAIRLCEMNDEELACKSSEAEQQRHRKYFMESRMIMEKEKVVAKSRKVDIQFYPSFLERITIKF